MQITLKHLIPPVLFPLLVLGLAACNGDGEEAAKPATQVAAKVNSGEISVHQLNYVLSRTPGVGAASPEAAPQIRREVLDRIIDQELAVEQAIGKKLDRSPEVLLAIENARREILARAYVEQITAASSKPTVDEATKYYHENPQLFAERRIYNIQEIVLPSAAGVAEELQGMLNAGKPMEDIANWLKSKDIKFAAGGATRSAEQIPLELLPRLHPLNVGQGLILQSPQTITVMRLAGAQSVPVTEEAALPRIQQFLGNQRAAEAARKELNTLKANANITYMGEFANADSSAASRTVTAPAPDVSDDASSESNVSAADVAVERGVAGLR
ncbi:MAG: peptidyl-prolyl cis-trans isomerase, EpsD family [Nitrosospira sp.]|nr:peptidyl-prolyl cis-trans isomerase, EpsD family [Nitrosospira sp.]